MAYLEFKNPLLLLLLVPWAAAHALLVPLGRLYAPGGGGGHILRERGTEPEPAIRARTYRFLPALRFAAMLLLIVALARPGRGSSRA